MNGPFAGKDTFAGRVAAHTIEAIANPRAILVLYVMFVMIVTGGYLTGVFQNIF